LSEDDLQDGVELRQRGVAADEESAPDERTDLAQGDTQLIETGRFRWLAHGWSVAQYAVSLKISPRNLALSMLDELRAQSIKFRSLTEHIDTETAAGRAMWQMIGVLAESDIPH
jgi:hypothetical protein